MNKERYMQYKQEYYQKNKEKLKEKYKKYIKTEKYKQTRRAYCERNKERINKEKRKYYKKYKERILNNQKSGICVVCGKKIHKKSKRCIKCNNINKRVFKREYEIGERVKKCQCGCGKDIIFQKNHIYKGISNYIWGHRQSPRKGKGKIYLPRYCSWCGKELDRKQLRQRKRCCCKEHGINVMKMNGKINRINQKFPKKDTIIERKMQESLRRLNIEFHTHKYINEIEHSYQCDIFIPIQNGITKITIIECDGDYWHGNENIYPNTKFDKRIQEHKKLDEIRTKEFNKIGYRIIRIWEHEINSKTEEELDNYSKSLLL